MKAIGIDIGTTSICGILTDSTTGILIKKHELPNDTWIITENSWEKIQNPYRILEKTTEILENLYEDDVASIGVTGQMHGIVYLSADGNPVSPLYTWQDERGNLEYNGSTYAESVQSHTGYGFVTHTYNKINELVPDDTVVFCTIHDFIAMKFAGADKPIVHSSDAASFGQYDLVKNQFTVNDLLLPEITSTYTVIGKYKNACVCVAIGDNQASFIGSGCDSEGLLINIGTGSQISTATDSIISADGIEIRPYVENQYLMAGCSLCGGKSYAVLADFFKKTIRLFTGNDNIDIYNIMNATLTQTDTSTLYVDNRFMGTRDDTQIRGSICNISTDNLTPQNLIRSMVDAMTNELYEMYTQMQFPYKRLIGSGNGIRKNKALAISLAEKFHSTLMIPRCQEEASYGAAIFSMVCIGAYSSISEAQKIINYGG